MNPDLEKLIELQRLDSAAHDAHRKLAETPEREKALDARLTAARDAVAVAKARLADSQNVRREHEKTVALHQGRLSKFREQAMSVKTNQEYHAIQKEIAFAQTEMKAAEDAVLVQMIEGDELAAAVKRAEAELIAEQKKVDADRKAMAAEAAELTTRLEQLATERSAVVASLTPQALATFELVAKRRNGIAIAEARDGICTICHVRMRPQVFNNVRRNDSITQCDSCQRILYFVPIPAPAPSTAGTAPAQ
ncbi:MAG TPA: C4-type zinc ribbon domain-containing protein [Vicinamibacterales bacterium]|nr:C4-type zinc ribbon domain-containing protein [Vicinamibacterales bacterium]